MPMERSEEPRSNEIDMDAIVSKKRARRYTERDFIFSDELTSKPELIEELEELDALKETNKVAMLAQSAVTTGGAIGFVYFSVKGLRGIDRWMKQQELDDIEEERRMTGQYISVDATDVDTAIDPRTGKNLTITKAKRAANATAVPGEGDAPAEAAEAGAPEKPEQKSPWLLRVLGLADVESGDDEDLWAAPAPTVRKEGGEGESEGGEPAAGDEGGDSGGGGGDGSGDGGGDGTSDDSSGVDTLDDLLG
jgi:hypothetical protein